MRPSLAVCKDRGVVCRGATPLRRPPTSVAATRRALKVLEPPGWKNVVGGRTPIASLRGVYEGVLISRGKSHTSTTYTHTVNKRWFKPNIFNKNHYSDVLDAVFNMPTSSSALRTIHKYGSFDNYLLNLPPGLLSRDTTKIRDTIREVIQAKLDSLPQERKYLPIGITSSVRDTDRVRPEEFRMGDELVATARARVDAWGAGAPVIKGGMKRIISHGKYGRGTHWRRQLAAVRVEGGGYASDSEAWLRTDAEGNLVQPGLRKWEKMLGARDAPEGVWEKQSEQGKEEETKTVEPSA